MFNTEGVLAAANVEKFKGTVYSVGPFGFRVGFAFQQERALNLIYALHHTETIKRRHKIMIAGGGLAGITAKIALHGLGYGNVMLYEERDNVFKAQQGAIHRPLHPSYNNWPIADHFSPTSNLPFMNWFAGSAAEVVAFIEDRWKTLYSRSLSIIRRGVIKHLKLAPGAEDESRRVRATVQKDGAEVTEDFDIVILATGFGVERDLDHSSVGSYWSPDGIVGFREEERETRQVFISGIGDGGLMDFARLGFRDAVKSDLAIETISRLRHSKFAGPRISLDQKHESSPVEDEIRDVEKRAQTLLPESAERPVKFGTKIENEIARCLRSGYAGVLQNLPSEAIEFLEQKLHPTMIGSNRLRLVGKLEAPFTCATAPINKLLVAYLLSKNPESYVRGYIDIASDELVRFDGSREPLGSSFKVLRHGGRPPAFVISKEFAKQNRSLNKSLANLTTAGRPDAELCAHLQHIVSSDQRSLKYREYRTELARAFSSRCMDLSLSPRVGAGTGEVPFWFEFDVEAVKKVGIKEAIGRLGGFPHELFGVKLLAVQPGDADSGLKRGA